MELSQLLVSGQGKKYGALGLSDRPPTQAVNIGISVAKVTQPGEVLHVGKGHRASWASRARRRARGTVGRKRSSHRLAKSVVSR